MTLKRTGGQRIVTVGLLTWTREREKRITKVRSFDCLFRQNGKKNKE